MERNLSGDLSKSLPLRKCGLKFEKQLAELPAQDVTSLAEVWIEMMYKKGNEVHLNMSLPLRKCGLKYRFSVF